MKNALFILLFLGIWGCEKNKLTEPSSNEDSITILDTIRFADLTNLFKNHCYQCHSASSLSFYGLNFDSYESTMVGSINGPVVTPFKPFESLLYIKCTEDFSENLSLNNEGKRMPEDNPDFFDNNPEKLKLIFDWIKQGCIE